MLGSAQNQKRLLSINIKKTKGGGCLENEKRPILHEGRQKGRGCQWGKVLRATSPHWKRVSCYGVTANVRRRVTCKEFVAPHEKHLQGEGKGKGKSVNRKGGHVPLWPKSGSRRRQRNVRAFQLPKRFTRKKGRLSCLEKRIKQKPERRSALGGAFIRWMRGGDTTDQEKQGAGAPSREKSIFGRNGRRGKSHFLPSKRGNL